MVLGEDERERVLLPVEKLLPCPNLLALAAEQRRRVSPFVVLATHPDVAVPNSERILGGQDSPGEVVDDRRPVQLNSVNGKRQLGEVDTLHHEPHVLCFLIAMEATAVYVLSEIDVELSALLRHLKLDPGEITDLAVPVQLKDSFLVVVSAPEISLTSVALEYVEVVAERNKKELDSVF